MKKIFYIIIAVISLFFIGTGKLLFEQQKDLLMQNSKEHIVDELVLLGGLAQLALMSKDYSQIEENLLNWVGHKEQIIFTEVALDSGFMIAQYGEKKQNPDYYTVTKAIPLFDGKNLIYTVDLSMESITNQLQSLFFTIVTWVVVSAIILISLLWLLIYRIAVVPLDKLMDGAQKIGQGHLDLAIEVKSQDEFGRLASEFNLMASKLKSLDITNKKALSTARRLADNLDNLPSPTLTVDREFHITFINKAGAAIAGLDPEECVGQFCYEVLNNSHCQTGDCRIAQAMAENRVTQAETILDPKGRNIPIRYLGAPIHDEEGTVIGGLESFVDVSELQNALDNSSRQNRIRKGEIKVNAGMQGQQQLTALCDNVLTVLCQWLDVQIGAIYLQDEKQFLRLTGGYAIRKDIEHASSFAMGEGIAGQAARQREIVIFNNIPANSIKLAGTAFEAAPLHSLAVPLLYEYNLKGVLELGSFTEFKQVDIEFIERIATNIAIAIDSAQVQEHINLLLDKTQQQTEELQAQQEELQASNEELREQTESLRTSESELQAQQEELRVTNEELTNQTNTLEKQQDDIKFKNEELAQQSNELSRKAEALETTSRFKSEFLANMSHELRTPLNSILILSQLLSSSRQDMSDKQLEYAQTINSSGTELLELINEVLDLSKVEAGKMELIPEPLNLEEFLAELQQAQGPVAENRGISLQTELSRDVPETLVTDGQKLHQIIKNLLSNA
ncbi:MAG: GAF domain-containing protein, partial [Desulfobulbaceae bacterium]|nr:GAF domain-containing protein [Desulfobulbaceae bacterium]